MFLSGVSMSELLHLHLVINVTRLVEPTEPGSVWKKIQLHLSSSCPQNCLLQSISVKLIYQFLYLIYCFLFFRCLEKVFEEERNTNKDGNSRSVTTSFLPQKEIRMMKFLALNSYLLTRITLTLISFFAIIGCFQKVNFQ